jgi:peroxiredoxin
MDRGIMPLRVAAVAPAFTLARSPRARLALHSLRGSLVVLAFYPMDWECVSREQLTLYEAYAGDFARLGAHLLAISVDHAFSHEAFARDAHLHFPLLADFQPRGRVAHHYGVYREAVGMSARALIVLDRQHVIRFSKAYPDELNPGVDELLTTLEALSSESAVDTSVGVP